MRLSPQDLPQWRPPDLLLSDSLPPDSLQSQEPLPDWQLPDPGPWQQALSYLPSEHLQLGYSVLLLQLQPLSYLLPHYSGMYQKLLYLQLTSRCLQLSLNLLRLFPQEPLPYLLPAPPLRGR